MNFDLDGALLKISVVLEGTLLYINCEHIHNLFFQLFVMRGVWPQEEQTSKSAGLVGV